MARRLTHQDWLDAMALLPDNTTEEISPKDERDAITPLYEAMIQYFDIWLPSEAYTAGNVVIAPNDNTLWYANADIAPGTAEPGEPGSDPGWMQVGGSGTELQLHVTNVAGEDQPLRPLYSRTRPPLATCM